MKSLFEIPPSLAKQCFSSLKGGRSFIKTPLPNPLLKGEGTMEIKENTLEITSP